MLKKIIGLTMAALLLLGVTFGATWAYFQDTETSSGNQLTAGTLDLKLSDANETDLDGVSASFSGSNLMPGDSVGPSTITLKNTGSATADHADIKFQNSVTDNASYNAADLGPNIADMSTVMTVTAMSYGVTNLLAQTVPGTFDNSYIEAADNAGNNNGIITMNELNNVIIQSLAAPAASGGTMVFFITINLPSSTGNGVQGDSMTTTVTFGLFQTSGQHLS
jgi:predicted ribosomally synthesized peptide with SipW-like signal peptide